MKRAAKEKKAQRERQRERVASMRESELPAEKEERLEKMRQYVKDKRAQETVEDAEERCLQNAMRMKKIRATRDQEEREATVCQDRSRKRTTRAEQDAEKREATLSQNRSRKRTTRAEQDAEKREATLSQNRSRKRTTRAEQDAEQREATLSQDRSRKRTTRAQQDAEQCEATLSQNRSRKRTTRAEQDAEQREATLSQNRSRKRATRAEQDAEQREATLSQDRSRKRTTRAEQDAEQREVTLSQNRSRKRTTRAEQDAEQREATLSQNRSRKRATRAEQDVEEREATLSQDRSRKRTTRAEEDAEQREATLSQNRSRKRTTRAEQDAEQREATLSQNRSRKRTTRAEQDVEQREATLSQDRSRKRTTRAEQDAEQREATLSQDRSRKRTTRAEQDAEQREATLSENRKKRCRQRQNRKRSNRDFQSGCRADEVMTGRQFVAECYIKPLFEQEIIDGVTTREPTGRKCEHCSAMLWPNEPQGLCCCRGSVELQPLFDTRNLNLGFMKKLCIGDSDDARIYRKFAKNINNAVSLASLKVQRVFPSDGGWVPAVVIQGKVAIQVGPILRVREPNSPPPVFSQLYVLDPDEADKEMEFRFGSLYLSSNVSEAEEVSLRNLLVKIVENLREVNPFVEDYVSAAEIIRDEVTAGKNIKIVLDADKRPKGEHARCFNTDFHEITVLYDDAPPGPRDVVLVERGRANEIKRLRDTNRCADPLRFTLMFPEGNEGWHLELYSEPEDKPRKRVTGRMFYSYHLMLRHPMEKFFSPVLHSGKLTQEYVCINAAKIENQELFYLKQKSTQKKLRADTYRRLTDQISAHDVEVQKQLQEAANRGTEASFEEAPIGKIGLPVILPASHTRSPRYMHQHYQDAMAIVRKIGKPDLFITFTCNPKWREITESLEIGETANDRPDIVARVFKEKFRCFVDDICKNGVLGYVVAHLYVIEFQKRGLPHAHMLIIFEKRSKIEKPEDVDEIISAEFPVPAECNEGIERERAEELLELVKMHMVHSCSPRCRPSEHTAEKCQKYFPYDYCAETMWSKNGYYPYYRRREDQKYVVEMPNGKLVDNRNVVPYCPWLLMRYKTHINVEVCISVRTVKYLYKYIHKGPDRMMCMPEMNSAEQQQYRNDEIEKYQDMRSIGSSEACWMIFSFPITERNPSVMALRVHLEDEHTVIVEERSEESIRTAAEDQKETELTAFFKFNRMNEDSKEKYCDFPKDHVWDKPNKVWRKRKQGNAIGRIHTVHPTSGDVFYLRLLLNEDHCKGKESFEDLRTVDGIVYDSYRAVCEALGLLQDDGEWRYVLDEAAETQSSPQIRDLFIVILMNCAPTNPRDLYESHCSYWMDDLRIKPRYHLLSEEQLQTVVLLKLEKKLQLLGRELNDFNLPTPTESERLEIAGLVKKQLATKDSVIRQEELQFDIESLKIENAEKYGMLNKEQKEIYDDVLTSIKNGVSGCYFIDARGGTGKTFLLNTLLSGVRTLKDEKNIALAVAYSGIAATLLSLGRTFHSRFKVPVDFVDETVTFRIKANDSIWKVIKEAKLIVWDEGPMSHRYLLEALDKLLRDVMGNDQVFGGKVLVISGDFRQVLPVIKHGSRAQVTAAALNQSHLWRNFQIRKLSQNMRVGDDPELEEFSEWLGIVGDGDIIPDKDPDWIELKGFNEQLNLYQIDDTDEESTTRSLESFVLEVLQDLQVMFNAHNWAQWISGRAILAPRNIEVDMINSYIISKIPGDEIVLTSADAAINDDDQTSFPTEFLNSQTPAGLPPHKLVVKIGMVLILLRNLNPRKGLCNGTRLILKKASTLLLECALVSDVNRRNSEETVLIPRIELITDKGEFAIQWKRRQFPVRSAFAMTINKSQGQTFRKVGLWLKEPCFSHGQFYVACSRVGRPDGLHIAVNAKDADMTRNVVYKESLTK